MSISGSTQSESVRLTALEETIEGDSRENVGSSSSATHRAAPATPSVPAQLDPSVRTVTVVIPARNEARNLPWVLERLPEWVDEVILVDGNSTDETVSVARSLCPDVVVVTEDRKGKGAALRAGFRASSCDYIVMLDADGSMDPREIARYVQPLHRDFDLIKGSRFMPGGGSTDITPLRAMGNRALLLAVNTLYRSKFSELCYGFFAFRRCHLEALNLQSDGFEIETEIVVSAVKAGLRIGEVPSMESPRMHGTSNLRPFRDGQRVLKTLVKAKFARRRPTTLKVTGISEDVGLSEVALGAPASIEVA